MNATVGAMWRTYPRARWLLLVFIGGVACSAALALFGAGQGLRAAAGVGTVLAMAVVLLPRSPRAVLVFLVLGLALRMGFAAFEAHTDLLGYTDGDRFHNQAASMLAGWQGGQSPGDFVPEWYHEVFSAGVAVLYWLFAPEKPLLNAAIAGIAVLSIAVLDRVVRRMSETGATAVTALFALLPSMVVFGGLGARDPLIWLALAVHLGGLVAWSERPARRPLVMAALGLAVAVVLRPANGVLVLPAVAWVFFARGRLELRQAMRTAALAAAAVLLGAVAVEVVFPQLLSGMLAGLTDVRASWAGGRTSYFLDWRFDDLWDVLVFLPIGGALFLLMPLPGSVGGLLGSLAVVENLFVIYPLLVLAAWTTWQMVRSRVVNALSSAAALGLALWVLVGVCAYGLVEANAGGALRHRVQFLYAIALAAGPGLLLAIRRLRASLGEQAEDRVGTSASASPPPQEVLR